ncbi:hypothetical protein [Geothrix sp.]|jgi:hypothetical protein|uniref:hypothetical protein n=1 Tax=Geothrix sp. TaxID=1962974 RepID=UPI0025C324F6|nr:hypothetical protein [Geothrix sp.]
MIALEILGTLAYLAWGLFTFYTAFQIFKLCWPVLKNDWFWFATKSAYYKGMFLGLGSFFLVMLPVAWLGQVGILIPMVVQAIIALKQTHNKSMPSLDRAVWYGMPFFMLPLWLTVRQGQKLGEIPRAA